MNAATAIVIDSREPDWVKGLTFGGLPTLVDLLESGDLLVSTSDNCLLSIERKAPDDLLGSIQDGRLFDQVGRMKAATPWTYVVIAGSLLRSSSGNVVTARGETGWSWAAVQGALMTVQELGATVVHVAESEYERVVLSLATRSRERVPVGANRNVRVLSPGEAAIAALPGIGPERLGLLDAVYGGRPACALEWLTDLRQNGEIAGIGLATRRKVREALGLDAWEWLAVRSEAPTLITREA